MYAPYDARLSPPCRHCGTTGGHWGPDARRPSRSRGLCQSCESWHAKRGLLDRYPLTSGNGLLHPVIPRDYTDPYQLGCDRAQHSVRPGYDWRAIIDDAEHFAVRWFADPGRRVRGMAWVWAQSDEALELLLFAGAHPWGRP